MMIGDDSSVAPHQEAGAKDIDLQMGSYAAGVELDHALLVDLRLAQGIDGDLNGLAGTLVEKFYDDVQQADAGPVAVNDGLGDLAFVFQKLEAVLRFRKLLLQS